MPNLISGKSQSVLSKEMQKITFILITGRNRIVGESFSNQKAIRLKRHPHRWVHVRAVHFPLFRHHREFKEVCITTLTMDSVSHNFCGVRFQNVNRSHMPRCDNYSNSVSVEMLWKLTRSMCRHCQFVSVSVHHYSTPTICAASGWFARRHHHFEGRSAIIAYVTH